MSSYIPKSTEGRVVLGCSVLLASCYVARKVNCYRRRRAKDEIRKEYQRKCAENIAAVAEAVQRDKDVDKTKATLASMTPREIVDAIKKGDLTAVQVLRGYQAKALDAHKNTNCVSWFFPEAEELALAADKCQKKEGLLFGLPVSLKDHFALQGHDTTNGLVDFLNKPYERDCLIVEVLRSHGAIPFVRTNIPQMMVSNPIFGYTTNPHDNTRGPGGSSGGEGAILGAGGSPLGFGSDIGGSIRMPSAWCGLFGFKPSTARMSHIGMPSFNYDQINICETYGPMSRDMDSIILSQQALWDGQMINKDQQMPPLMFNFQEFESKKPLKIGYYYALGDLQPVPAVRRAVDMSVASLRASGHELVEYSPPDTGFAMSWFFKILFAHGGSSWREVLEDEQLDKECDQLLTGVIAPAWLKKINVLYAKVFLGQEAVAETKALLGINSSTEYRQEGINVVEYRNQYQESWDSEGLDALVGPTFAFPAMPTKNKFRIAPGLVALASLVYTAFYNALDLPAGNVPVTKVTKADISAMTSYPDNNELLLSIHEGMRGAEGLPVGVQVIAPRYRDERALRLMRELDSSLTGK